MDMVIGSVRGSCTHWLDVHAHKIAALDAVYVAVYVPDEHDRQVYIH